MVGEGFSRLHAADAEAVMSQYSAELAFRARARGRTVSSADDCRRPALTAPAGVPGRMDKSLPTTRHRVPRGGEPRSPGAVKGPPSAVDGRPAAPSRSERASAGPTTVESGCHDRDAGHDPALASAPDCGEVELRAETTRASENDEDDREAHRADGDGEPDVGL